MRLEETKLNLNKISLYFIWEIRGIYSMKELKLRYKVHKVDEKGAMWVKIILFRVYINIWRA